MKTYLNTALALTAIVILFLSFPLYAQTKIQISLDPTTKEQTSSLENGKYDVEISGLFDPTTTYFKSSLTITTSPVDIITTPPVAGFAGGAMSQYAENFKFRIKDRTLVVIVINEIDIATNNVINTYTYTFKGIPKYQWHTTVGLAAITLLNRDTYKTVATDNAFQIVQDGSQTIFNPVVLMQFTYINLETPTNLGVSGGIGFDFENISVFGGPSIYFGHNLILTAGLALNQQLRLDSKYEKNQIVSEAIDPSDLNTHYYRVNPFVSLTFALDNNLFRN
ncbi:MAG: hypothetical protein AAF489_09175 [Bacteroidota bacterium]